MKGNSLNTFIYKAWPLLTKTDEPRHKLGPIKLFAREPTHGT